MSQSDPDVYTTTAPGNTFCPNVENALKAAASCHSGATAPAYLVAGTLWLDTSEAPAHLKRYDGSAWRYVDHAPGEVTDFAGATAPTGALLCYGQEISETTYATLFAAIGTTYNTGGEGAGNFRVPDLRGRVVAGQDDMGGSSANRLTGLTGGVNGDTLGATGGEEAHVLVTAELAAHNHSVTNNAVYAAAGGAVNILQVNGASTTGSAGSDTAHNNVQPVAILNKIIWY